MMHFLFALARMRVTYTGFKDWGGVCAAKTFFFVSNLCFCDSSLQLPNTKLVPFCQS